MINESCKILSSFRKLEISGDKTDFLEQVSLKILEFSRNQKDGLFAEYASDVFMKFSLNLNGFLSAYYCSGHQNLQGFLSIFIRNIFLNLFKEYKRKDLFVLSKMYNNEVKNEQMQKNDLSDKDYIKDLFFNDLNSEERIILFLRFDITISEIDEMFLKRLLKRTQYSFEDVMLFMQIRRADVRRLENSILDKISTINNKIYNQDTRVYKFNLYLRKKELYKKLWIKREFYSINDTMEILGVSRYRVIATISKFKNNLLAKEIETQVA
jgi:hypothetical protein